MSRVPEMPELADEAAVQDFLQILDEHRKACEQQGRYVEAEIAKNRLLELRHHEEARREEALKSRQIAERLGVEEAHMVEFQEFTKLWDKKINDYEFHAKELADGLREKHQIELNQFHESVSRESVRPKRSRDLLNLRRIEETLARQKEYAEAQKIKLKADNMEAWELERYRADRLAAVQGREDKLRSRQSQELGALKKRVQSMREELKKQRQIELERLLQRFQNVKNELSAQQQLERKRMAKYGSNASQLVARTSRVSTPSQSPSSRPKKRAASVA